MIKSANVLIIILLLPFILSGQVQRLLLAEEFTNASSQPCAIQNPAFDALIGNNSNKIVAVKYHVNWPGPDPMYDQNKDESQVRSSYYNITGVPCLKVDGKAISGPNYSGAPANLTQEKINALSSIPAPFFIKLEYNKSGDNDSLFIYLVIKAEQPINGNLSAHIAVLEKNVVYPSTPGSNGEKVFTSVMRKMLPDAYGTQMPYSFQAGDSVVLTESWAVQNISDLNQVCVVGWVQDNLTREVYQASYCAPEGPAYVNATMVKIDKPGSLVCGNTISPRVVIANLGGPALTSLEITYGVNGGNNNTFEWNGYLNFLDQAEVVLPPVSFNPLAGNNIITVFTSHPNGTVDFIPSDDTLSKSFQTAYTTGSPITVEIRTDQYPQESCWKIINSSGNIVATGGPYLQANTLESSILDINSGDCYEFIMVDLFGDGICCKYGNGSYKLKDQNGVVFIQGGSFGAEESTSFKIDLNMGIPEPELISDFQVFPNPFDNTATISLYLPSDLNVTLMVMNEVGQFVYTMDKVILKAGNHTFDLNGETWTPGVYFVKVLAGDKLITRKLSLTK